MTDAEISDKLNKSEPVLLIKTLIGDIGIMIRWVSAF